MNPKPDSKDARTVTIIDGCLSFPPILELDAGSSQATTMTQTEGTTLPTESRIKQKERFKAEREAGIKPRKIKKRVEDGNDDCGEDLSGLGKDISSRLGGVIPEYLESSDDEDESLSMPLPPSMPDTHSNVFSIMQSPRYGANNCVGMLNLCGGERGTSELAF